MGTATKIEWADHTFNAWRGCVKVAGHPACDHCYAEAMSKRNPKTLGTWGGEDAGGVRVMAAPDYWRLPIKWNRNAAAAGKRATVFALSLGDVCEDWRGPVVDTNGRRLGVVLPGGHVCDLAFCDLPASRPATLDDVRQQLGDTIDATPNLIWLLLTKRPENIVRHFGDRVRENVLFGVSASDQATLESQWLRLTSQPRMGRGLFISLGPLLGFVDVWSVVRNGPMPDWIIAEGESGPHARRCCAWHVRTVRDQCCAMRVPFFFKQWGEWLPGGQDGAKLSDGQHLNCSDDYERVGKHQAGNWLDGRQHLARPAWFDAPIGLP